MKARIFWIVVGVLLVAGVATQIVRQRRAVASHVDKPPDPTLVQTAKVRRAGIGEALELTGTIRAGAEVDIFPKVGGRIESVAVQVGDLVKPGATLASIEHREISWQARAAQAQQQVAQANLGGAKQNLERTEALFKGGSVTQAQLDGARTQHALAEAQAAAAEAAAGLAAQQVANARLDTPIGGTVTKKTVQVGAMVGPGGQQPLFSVQDVASLKMETSADAASFARLAKGQPCSVSVDALPGEAFSCTVAVLSPSLDVTTRRAAVELAVDNAKGRLLPNMFAKAVVTVGELRDAVVLPREAVLELPGGAAAVFRVKAGKVERVQPELGARDGVHVQVVSGLSEGDEVVVGNLGALLDGSPVKTTTSATAALNP